MPSFCHDRYFFQHNIPSRQSIPYAFIDMFASMDLHHFFNSPSNLFTIKL